MNVYNSGQQGIWNSHSKRIKMEGQNISGDSVLTREKLYSGQQSTIPEIDYFSLVSVISSLDYLHSESLALSLAVIDDLQQMVEAWNQKVS